MNNLPHSLRGRMQPHTHALVPIRHGGAVHNINIILIEHTDFTALEDAEGHTGTTTLPDWHVPQNHTHSKPYIALAVSGRASTETATTDGFHTYPGNLHHR